ncbi:hypothetical protein LJR030_003240 [Rhizobium sp. LjRoot30]|uniref:hypothetical protein n=1 Tax=Rhizobium sp. LjRoot30 TaxID=3342320 RepID=UPI003ECD741D
MATFRPRQHSNAARYDFIPPEKGTSARKASTNRKTDIVDAEFVVIRDPRPRNTSSFRYNDNKPSRALQPHNPPASRLAMLARLLVGCERLLRRVPERAFTGLVALLFVIVFGVSGGFYGIAGASTPGPASVKPLDITHVSLTPQDANGMRVLLVNGIVENRTEGTMAVPGIRADLVSGDRLIASTIIEPPVGEIDGGHSRGFSARLPHLGGKIPDIRLSFTEPGVSRP